MAFFRLAQTHAGLNELKGTSLVIQVCDIARFQLQRHAIMLINQDAGPLIVSTNMRLYFLSL